MFGAIKLENFTAANLPQKGATAWSGAGMDNLTGKSYKPILYLGEEPVHGANHYFIAEQTDVYPPFERRVIKFAIYELDGEYTFLDKSIIKIA